MKLLKVYKDFLENDFKVVVSAPNGNLEKLIDKEVDVIEHKEKRSLSQNNYAWKLINEIASVLNTSKEEAYMSMLERYAPSEKVSMIDEINPKGYFKYYKQIGTGQVKGKNFIHYLIYKGSSEYDTKEMSVFIDGVISECKTLGIETLSEEEIAKMKLI